MSGTAAFALVAALAILAGICGAQVAEGSAPLVENQAPSTPAVDYVVPLARQPFASDPDVIWYDSFDEPGAAGRYLEFVSQDGLWGQVDDVALGGVGGSIRGLFKKGTVSGGNLKLAFGDWPAGRVQARPGERFDQVYWRVYVKHQSGWVGNPAKLSRAISMAGSNWSQAMIAHVWGGRGLSLTLDPATGIDPSGRLATTKYNDFAHLRWLGNKPEGKYPIFAAEASGKWVCVEAAARLNTPGKADGAFSLWIDGQLDTHREGLDWRGTWTERGINAIFLENYWNEGSPVDQARYFDDFVVSTQPIGLARAGLNPEIMKAPFAARRPGSAQSGWQAQVAADPGAEEVVWDSGVIEGAGNRVRVDKQHGSFAGRLAGRNELEPGALYAVRVRQRDTAGVWSAWSAWRTVLQTAAPAEMS